MFKVLGSGDDVTVCDCCGRKNLKITIALENEETGEQVRYGRDCAGKAIFGSKSKKNADNVTSEAKAVSVWKRVLEFNPDNFKKASDEVFQRTGQSIHKSFDGNVYHRVSRKGKLINVIL